MSCWALPSGPRTDPPWPCLLPSPHSGGAPSGTPPNAEPLREGAQTSPLPSRPLLGAPPRRLGPRAGVGPCSFQARVAGVLPDWDPGTRHSTHPHPQAQPLRVIWARRSLPLCPQNRWREGERGRGRRHSGSRDRSLPLQVPMGSGRSQDAPSSLSIKSLCPPTGRGPCAPEPVFESVDGRAGTLRPVQLALPTPTCPTWVRGPQVPWVRSVSGLHSRGPSPVLLRRGPALLAGVFSPRVQGHHRRVSRLPSEEQGPPPPPCAGNRPASWGQPEGGASTLSCLRVGLFPPMGVRRGMAGV